MKRILILLIFILTYTSSFSQRVIPLYNGAVPLGNELLTISEKLEMDDNGEVVSASNVSMPTLTVYQPEREHANGTAMIVCPGGGFRNLSVKGEGIDVANWLISHGITAFVLKYRLVPETRGTTKDLIQDLISRNFEHMDSVNAPFVPLAVADGFEAVKYIRMHASEFGIDPGRIGIMGFSAGGTVSGSVALTYDEESRPDFAALIYAYCKPFMANKVPSDAPPLFLTMAANDFIANDNTKLYELWRDAGKSVEMHCFYNGGHGFGIEKRGQPTDKWFELLKEWMDNLGLLIIEK